MRLLRNILLLLLAFVLQTTWTHALEIAACKPDLILMALVYVALRTGELEATILGFCLGFLQDLYMPDDLGLNALANALIGFALGYGRTGIVVDSLRVQVTLICSAILVHDLIFYLGSSGIALADVPFFWLRYSLGRAFYSGLCAMLISGILLARRRFLPT